MARPPPLSIFLGVKIPWTNVNYTKSEHRQTDQTHDVFIITWRASYLNKQGRDFCFTVKYQARRWVLTFVWIFRPQIALQQTSFHARKCRKVGSNGYHHPTLNSISAAGNLQDGGPRPGHLVYIRAETLKLCRRCVLTETVCKFALVTIALSQWSKNRYKRQEGVNENKLASSQHGINDN